MLMKIGRTAAVNNVVFQRNTAATFVCVKSPTSVSQGVDVMNQIVAKNRARLEAERINPAHIAEHFLADIVEMIEFDDIGAGRGLVISPGPTDRNRSVKSVMNFVVRNVITGGLKQKYPNSRRINDADIVIWNCR